MPDDIPFNSLGQNSNESQPAMPLESFLNDSESAAARAIRVRRTVASAESAYRSWCGEAKIAKRFRDGHQWDDYDRMIMENSTPKRPVLTFNEISKYIHAISGLERVNRTDVRFVSRPLGSTMEQDALGDLASEAVSAVDDVSEASIERSLCVDDLATMGMGWMEIRTSFEIDLDGEIIKERIDPFEMRWDQHARRPGLADTRWRARVRNMPKEIFKKRWPDKVDMVDMGSEEAALATVQKYELVTPYISLENQQANPQVGGTGVLKDTIKVIQFQEQTDVEVYRVASPDDPNKLVEFSEKDWKELIKELKTDNLPTPPHVRQTKTIHRQLYVANGVELEEPVILPGNRFSLIPMTGEWDDERKIWIGLVPGMIDPQKTKNKSLSHALHFYLTNAKGGVMAETGAFVNPTRAKDEWAAANPWIELSEGGLKKIQQRSPVDLPPALQMFFQVSTRGVGEVIGLSPEFLGFGEGEVSNPTQQSRLTAGLAILGWFFDEVNRFKKEEARCTLDFVTEFMTDGRLMTIGGPFHTKTIPLLKSNLPKVYSLEVDESIKHNPNLKAQVWKDLQPIIPALLRFGAAKALLYLLKFSPLPAELVNGLQREFMQSPPEQGGRGKKETPEEQKAKLAKLSAEAQRTLAQARAIDQQAQAKVSEVMLEGLRLDHEIAKENKEFDHKKTIDTINILNTLLPGAAPQMNSNEMGGMPNGPV